MQMQSDDNRLWLYLPIRTTFMLTPYKSGRLVKVDIHFDKQLAIAYFHANFNTLV